MCLTDLEGNEVVFENPDMRPMGGFSEGKVLVTWETVSYTHLLGLGRGFRRRLRV